MPAIKHLGLADIDYDEIVPGLFVGSAPCSPRLMKFLKTSGFDAVMDVCASFEYEQDWAKDQGLEFFSREVRDTYSPSQEQYVALTKKLSEWLKAGKKVYLHCYAGLGRSPIVAAAYLVATGVVSEDALATVYAGRPRHRITDHQREGLREFERRVRNR